MARLHTDNPSNHSPSRSSRKEINWTGLLVECAVTTALGVAMWFVMKPFISDLTNPDKGIGKDYDKGRLQKIVDRRAQLRSSSEEDSSSSPSAPAPKLILTNHEQQIAEGVVDPSDMATQFADIGGIDNFKAEIYDLIVMPLRFPELYRSGGVEAPKGILLYGAPGTGKTMLAKAIAKEGGAAFVNVKLSSIMNKWFGESQKMVSAVFSLASKLAPSVIFIDEIDTFLRQRDGESGDSSLSSMKSEFLTLWDGILTDKSGENAPVVVLGATNRPYDVDTAILRRLPRTFEIGLPDEAARFDILKLQLSKARLTNAAAGSLKKIAAACEGFSGADLKELSRAAAMEPVREITEAYSKSAVSASKNGSASAVKIKKGTIPRPIDVKDFEAAMKKVKKTGAAAEQFREKEKRAGVKRDGGKAISSQDIQLLTALLFQNMQNASRPNNGGSSGNDGVEVLD
jgi:SpoVK/Ycf46/Vps4 family AAA+-type ATPase